MCNSTAVIPFRLNFQPGVALCDQVVYAAKKAATRPADADRAAGKATAKSRSNGSSAKGSTRPAGKASAGTRASSGKPHPRSRKKKKRK